MALIISDEVTGWRSCQSAKRGIKISIRQGTYGWTPDSQHPNRSFVGLPKAHSPWELRGLFAAALFPRSYAPQDSGQ